MAVISIKNFGGISPKTPTRMLQDSQAQVAINCPVFSGTINPLPSLSTPVTTLGKAGTAKTIYRFGQDVQSDAQYWFSWNTDVDVCRGQIAGDTSEWTFYTGEGAPKATYASLALSGSSYPAAFRPLGIPAPTIALTVGAASFTPKAYPAEVTITAEHIKNLTTTNGLQISTTNQENASYTTVALTGTITATSVAAAINAATSTDHVTATVDGTGVIVKTLDTNVGPNAKLFVRGRAGTTFDTAGTYTYSGYDKTGVGLSDSYPVVVLPDSEISSIGANDFLAAYADGAQYAGFTAPGPMTAAQVASTFQSLLTPHLGSLVYGGSVAIFSGDVAGSASSFIEYARYSASNGARVTYLVSHGSDAPAGGSVTMTQTELNAFRGHHMSIKLNGTEFFVLIPENATLADMPSLLYGKGVTVVNYGSTDAFIVIASAIGGASTSIQIRNGTYPATPAYGELTATGYDDTPSSTETRAYTWTWVNKEAGFEFESAPAGVAATVDAYQTQAVSISGRESVPAGYTVTHWRLYRSVNGTYLFVDELPVSQTSYTDSKLAEDLSETLPSMTWSPPPAGLRGLINLPNGIMAGFVGRDVYFCDPYHPHAWPENYVITLDYPIVGLGRMDTTLAVLTTGTPYFIQGSHPDSMVAVKSDLEQACASKRSIVSTNGVVIYASPDGLVMLSSSGSKLITENLFTRAQWQAYFNPTTLNAFSHDLKYIAFFERSAMQDLPNGGFIFDATSGQLIMHDIYANAGYSDLQRDQLFLVTDAGGEVKKWLGGAPRQYTWRSKKFWMPKPTTYTCAQVEAEAYPVSLYTYVDGVLGHTIDIPDRAAFRLPVLVGRDWEFELHGTAEIFSLAVAQSMEEIAGV